MSASAWIIFWWVLFGGTHILGSSVAVRTRLVRALGLGPFKGIYSLVALATFIPLCRVFFTSKHAGAYLFSPPEGVRYVTEGLMLAAFVILFQGLLCSSPLTTMAELAGRKSPARGILRVTRHPMNLAFGIFGLAHCLSNPFLGDWLFFGGFVLYALVSAFHQDRRTLAAGSDDARRFVLETSYFPFVAIAGGKQRLALREMSPAGLIIAVAAYFLLRHYHGDILGGFVA